MKRVAVVDEFLFDDSFFSLEPEIVKLPEPEPVVETAAAEPKIDKSRLMKKGDWSERKAVRRLLVDKTFPVVMQKSGYSLKFVPHTIGAAALLHLAGWDRVMSGNSWSTYHFEPDNLRPRQATGNAVDTEPHGTLTYSARPWFETSTENGSNKLKDTIENLGVEIIMPPSIERWIQKTKNRHQVEMTSLELPNVKDERPLFERLEMGLMLTCKESYLGFKSGETYVVIETPEERKTKDEDKKETEDNEPAEEPADDTSYKLLRLNAAWYEKPLEYSIFDGPMEDHFYLELDNAKLYDAEKCIPAKFPNLIKQYESKLKKNEKLWNGLYLHAQKDAPQGACLRHVFLGDPMRTGKSSKAIAIIEAAGTQKVGVVTPPNARAGFYRELIRLGFPESSIVVVHQEHDLHRKGRWFLMTYNWLKRGRDPKDSIPEKNSPAWNNVCPHCASTLYRPVRKSVKLADGKKLKYWTIWSPEFGFMCRNKACSYTKPRLRSRGAAWGTTAKEPAPLQLKAYVDWNMAKIANIFAHGEKYGITKKHINEKTGEKRLTFEMKPRSRQEKFTGWVKEAWVPQMSKRAKKLFNALVVDEIHWIKSGTTSQAKAIMELRAKRTVGLTGTLMPNTPQDAFYPLAWIFGAQNHRFPYKCNKDGVSEFNSDFTEQVTVQTSESTRYRRRASYLKSPIKFWSFMAPKMLRRGYQDPLVVESFSKAGMCMPTWDIKTINIQPSPTQARLIVNSIDEFKKAFADYKEDLKKKLSENAVTPTMMNQSLILRQMTHLRIAATCPGWLLEKGNVYHDMANNIQAMFGNSPYKGEPGGCKMPIVKQTVAERVAQGGKVLILSDFRYNQKLLEKELFLYDPIRFDTSWSEEKRIEAFDQFQDPKSKYKVFIAGPRAVREGVDLSIADTCICTDLLWTPGLQQQGWFRILTPRPTSRHCEILLLVTKYSVDMHVYATFYAKMTAAEQALDRRILTKKDKEIDIQYFVDAVLSERSSLMEYIRETEEEDAEMMEMPLILPTAAKHFLEMEA